MRRVILGLVLAACAAVGTASARQGAPSEFSATQVVRLPELGATEHNKLYVSKDRMRMESKSLGVETVVLADLKTGKTFLLMPERRIVMEQPGIQLDSQMLSELQRELQRMHQQGEDSCASSPDYTCERLGTERVGGLSAQKWRMVSKDPNSARGDMRVWIAPELGWVYPVRTEDEEGNTVELTDIQLGKQPDSLFEVPAGYRKVDSLF